jgi:predicted nucleic acid-binding protein
MILVDASIVIDYERSGDPKLLRLFKAHAAALCGVTRAEVLYGVRNPADRPRVLAALNSFAQVAIPDALWDAVGDNLATLRAAGLRFPFPDVVLATVAIANDIELWTRDQQFKLIKTVLPALRLFAEPP